MMPVRVCVCVLARGIRWHCVAVIWIGWTFNPILHASHGVGGITACAGQAVLWALIVSSVYDKHARTMVMHVYRFIGALTGIAMLITQCMGVVYCRNNVIRLCGELSLSLLIK